MSLLLSNTVKLNWGNLYVTVSFPEGERVYPRIRIRMLIPPKITYTKLPLPPLKKET